MLVVLYLAFDSITSRDLAARPSLPRRWPASRAGGDEPHALLIEAGAAGHCALGADFRPECLDRQHHAGGAVPGIRQPHASRSGSEAGAATAVASITSRWC